MMFATGYFLYTDGIFSYAGFVAIEVIAISTLMACLMLLDAVSALKCRVNPKRSVEPAAQVATGADYESEDEKQGSRILKKRK